MNSTLPLKYEYTYQDCEYTYTRTVNTLTRTVKAIAFIVLTAQCWYPGQYMLMSCGSYSACARCAISPVAERPGNEASPDPLP